MFVNAVAALATFAFLSVIHLQIQAIRQRDLIRRLDAKLAEHFDLDPQYTKEK